METMMEQNNIKKLFLGKIQLEDQATRKLHFGFAC